MSAAFLARLAALGALLPARAQYPAEAAGWGPAAGKGQFVSRWAEDSGGKRAPFKAVPLGRGTSLTLSAETRLRWDAYDNGLLVPGNDYAQGLLRGVVGADLRLHPSFRLYAELGTGQVRDRRDAAPANFQNRLSLQQAFLEARRELGPVLVGAMLGRQEFADGPRQLVSVSDGPNLHRTWNGARLYAQGRRLRAGAFDFRVTKPGREGFDETASRDERLRGADAGLVLAEGAYLDVFWLRTAQPAFRLAGRTGRDDRDTWGARLWGRREALSFDWTLARQTGRSLGRPVEAWAVFAVQSLRLSDRGWKPRLGARVDAASGGAYGAGPVRGFNQLYASSAYLGEGLFLSTSNLLLVTPGISVAPTPATALSLEVGAARRLREDDAVYGGQMRAYAGTQKLPGRGVGTLLRLAGAWSPAEHLTFNLDYEHFQAGETLAPLRPSGGYGYLGVTFRY